MTSSKSTKRALIYSTLALLMCVAMLIGTTFAWFTDTASTGVNKIVSGNLKVDIIGANSDSVILRRLNFTLKLLRRMQKLAQRFSGSRVAVI
ncbi:MAG: SipW-dependent-type signal peptide-containing protein [Clostridia bacterium]